MAEILKQSGLTGKKVLLLTAAADDVLFRAGRNLPKLTIRPAAEASTLDLMHAHTVLLQEGAVDALTSALRPSRKPTAAGASSAEPAEA